MSNPEAPKGGHSPALDPHARSAEHQLRPDPGGEHDPIGRADLDPHARASDFTLRPDPKGAHDPLAVADLDPHARAAQSGSVGDTAASTADRLKDAGDKARERLTEHADAIQDKLGDAAEEARERARAAYGGARAWASDVHQSNMRRIDDLTDRGVEGLNRGRTAVERFVDENPLLVGVVGVAAGLLLGALLPRTRQEDRNIGPLADEVRSQGLRYAREFTDRGREFVQTALDPDNLNAAARKAASDNEPPRPSDPVRQTL